MEAWPPPDAEREPVDYDNPGWIVYREVGGDGNLMRRKVVPVKGGDKRVTEFRGFEDSEARSRRAENDR
jgi:hypothetical protein